MKTLLALTALLSMFSVANAGQELSLTCKVQVPERFQHDPPGWVDPNGQPERVRYSEAYKAFWWNCVMVKASDLSGRCPIACSGTPGATYGCGDGAVDAWNQIDALLKKFPAKQVRAYLQSLAKEPKAKAMIAAYFPNGPKSD